MDSIFMQYICKNCGCMFLEQDRRGRMTPIKGYYCPECIKKYGYINPSYPIKKQLTEKQLENLKKGREIARKNQAKKRENENGGINE